MDATRWSDPVQGTGEDPGSSVENGFGCLSLAALVEQGAPPAPGASDPGLIVAGLPRRTQIIDHASDSGGDVDDSGSRRNLLETLTARHRHRLDLAGDLAAFQSPQQGVEPQLRSRLAKAPRLPIDKTGAGIAITEDGIHLPPQGDALDWLGLQGNLGAFEASGAKRPEALVERPHLSNHLLEITRLQAERSQFRIHRSADLFAAHRGELLRANRALAEVAGKDAVRQSANERRPRFGPVDPSQSPGGLLGTTLERLEQRRRDHQRFSRSDLGKRNGWIDGHAPMVELRLIPLPHSLRPDTMSLVPDPPHMSRQLRIALIAVAVPITLLVWATAVFAMDRVSNGGEVLGSVTVAGADLGGLAEADARQELLELEERLSTVPISVTVAGETFSLLPSEIGFSIDVDSMLADAMVNGREGGVGGQFGWWVSNLTGGETTSVSLVTGFSQNHLNDVLDQWVIESIDNPAYEGGIEVVDGAVQAVYPTTGLGIDKEQSADLVAKALVDFDRVPIELPTQVITPTRTNAELDAIVAKIETDAAALIDTPVTLSWLTPPVSVKFSREILEQSLGARLVSPDSDEVELFFDPDPLITHLLSNRDEIEQPPLDARIVARQDEEITIIPGRSELLIDELGVSGAVLQAARSATKAGVFPFKEGEEPALSTEAAQELHVDYLLYRATTFYSCCGDWMNQNRIKNIQRIAEEADGALVMPGETWSLNEYVGQRTIDDGYYRAGAIIGPIVQCCDHPANIGGGVSQFATTMYNAVFFSGMKDIAHTPHTLHFGRYPMGREATLGFPTPDVVFKNTTDAAVLIDTDADDTSVTVRFYGNNGEIEVESGLSDQRNWVDPPEHFIADPAMDPTAEPDQVSTGKPGFTVTVFRYITHPDGEETTETWVWTYDPFPDVFAVNPCKLDPEHTEYLAACPTGVPNLFGRNNGSAVSAIEAGGWVPSWLRVKTSPTRSANGPTRQTRISRRGR